VKTTTGGYQPGDCVFACRGVGYGRPSMHRLVTWDGREWEIWPPWPGCGPRYIACSTSWIIRLATPEEVAGAQLGQAGGL
jgi:hypothetical protein